MSATPAKQPAHKHSASDSHKPAPPAAAAVPTAAVPAAPAMPGPEEAKPTEPQKATEAAGAAPDVPADVVPRQRLVFPAILTIAAVFPLAIGVGTACLKGSTSPKPAVVSTLDHKREYDVVKERPTARPIDRRIGDQSFLEQRYEAALQYYQSIGTSDSMRRPPELTYRIALCQECLGLWDEAMESLQAIPETPEDATLGTAIAVAQSRLWIRLKQPAKAEAKLRSVVLNSGSLNSLPREMLREIEFLVPLTLSQIELSNSRKPFPVEIPLPVLDVIVWKPENTLEWCHTPIRTKSTVADALSVANELGCRILRPSVTPFNQSQIEDWRVNVCCHNQSIRSLVMRLTDECGWDLDLTELPNGSLMERIVNFDAQEFPVCLLLTTVCSELHATWTLEDRRLSIVPAAAQRDQFFGMITQTLHSVIDQSPEHRLARHARFAIAELALFDEQFLAAAQRFSSLVSRDSSIFSINAAYNAAVSYCRVREDKLACAQLEYMVNSSNESELQSKALILYGRLLLDRGQYQEATYQLRRAADSRTRPETAARAAVLLGLSHLIQDKLHEGADAVFLHRTLFQDPSARNGASFVTAYARWHALKGERQDREAAYLYRSLLAVKTDSAWLGMTGQLLIGRALADLGFGDQMVDVYTQLLHEQPSELIAHEVRFSLAELEFASGRAESAMELWRELTAETEDPWTNRARFKLAERAFLNGDFEECLNSCRMLLHRAGITPDSVLKLMGRAYEQTGDQTRAAQSYAGQTPPP